MTPRWLFSFAGAGAGITILVGLVGCVPGELQLGPSDDAGRDTAADASVDRSLVDKTDDRSYIEAATPDVSPDETRGDGSSPMDGDTDACPALDDAPALSLDLPADCYACAQKNCCTRLRTCAENPSCVAIEQCIEKCIVSDGGGSPCAIMCMDKGSGGGGGASSDSEALNICIEGSCSAECGL
jgi:hypothetical protein